MAIFRSASHDPPITTIGKQVYFYFIVLFPPCDLIGTQIEIWKLKDVKYINCRFNANLMSNVYRQFIITFKDQDSISHKIKI